MPKHEHAYLFSAQTPLPWVPDLVGPEFGKANPSVLIVGSSYNGFLKGYTNRNGTMNVEDYVAARDFKSVQSGLKAFFSCFIRDVCGADQAYYARLCRLLHEAGIPMERACLTDLCKASFVRKTETNRLRSDAGNDTLIQEHISEWQCYVLGAHSENLKTAPLPYQWLGKRFQQAHIILALGKLAEYGVIKVLMRQAPTLRIVTHQPPFVKPDQASLGSGRNWGYDYAHTQRGVKSWLQNCDWWNLDDPDSGKLRQVLPCVHPSAWNNQEDDYVQNYSHLFRLMAAERRQC